MFTNIYLAQTYGGGTYNQSTYQSGTSTGSNAGGTGATSGGTLTNTGFDLLVIATLACVIVLAALLIRFWKRPKLNKS